MKKIVLALFLSLVFVLLGCSNSDVKVPTENQAEDPKYNLGNASSSVRIVEYSDYECPFCGAFHKDAFPQIKEKYIDTGLVSFEFKDFPIPTHIDAEPAAEAAYCAGDLAGEEKFWEMSAYLFENQDNLTKKALSQYAEDLELDVVKFDQCVNEKRFFNVISNNFKEGVQRGVSGTPSIFINDVKITGAQPFSVFEEVIEKLLEE